MLLVDSIAMLIVSLNLAIFPLFTNLRLNFIAVGNHQSPFKWAVLLRWHFCFSYIGLFDLVPTENLQLPNLHFPRLSQVEAVNPVVGVCDPLVFPQGTFNDPSHTFCDASKYRLQVQGTRGTFTPTTSAAMAAPTFRGTAILLIVAHLPCPPFNQKITHPLPLSLKLPSMLIIFSCAYVGPVICFLVMFSADVLRETVDVRVWRSDSSLSMRVDQLIFPD